MVGKVSMTMTAAAFVVVAGCSTGGNELESAEPTPAPSTAPAPTTTLPASTTTTTTIVEDQGRDEDCVETVEPGDSLGAIAVRIDGIELQEMLDENGLAEASVIHPGDELDICFDNDTDDVTGASRLAPPADVVTEQQEQLNTLFGQYRMIPLAVDGDSGSLTRQMVCAARVGLGLPASTAHLDPESDEAEAILGAELLGVPDGAPTTSRWIVIDRTCQVLFTGEGNELVNIYPTSTGEPGHETYLGNAFRATRFDPALDTDGWHDSSSYPVEVDNPLNGNMYKPIYFNEGQAIHGAGYVPPTPRSKGCARTFPLHQDELIAWLGIGDVTEATWQASTIDLTVKVQGTYRPLT